MLVIRKKQKDILNAHMRERYILDTTRNLRSLFPGEPRLEDPTYPRALIEKGIERAHSYDITRERETSLFIYLMQEFGEEFDRDGRRPWIASTLRDENLDEQQKMDLIYSRLAGPEDSKR